MSLSTRMKVVRGVTEAMSYLFSSSAPLAAKSADAESRIEFADCEDCAAPCDHVQMPASMAKRVSQDHLYNTFKPYVQHLIIEDGSGKSWAHSVEDVSGSLAAKSEELLATFQGRVMISNFEVPPLEPLSLPAAASADSMETEEEQPLP